jgi:hypothetical protein
MALTAVQARWRQVKLIAGDYRVALLRVADFKPYWAQFLQAQTSDATVPPRVVGRRFFLPSSAVAWVRAKAQVNEATVGILNWTLTVTREQRGKQWKLPAALRARLGHRNIL